ncbi:MAG: DNA repair protein RecN [Paludibacteraceae bacterium]|nr:DNA repair protein RecN [Paludibacteraceae bacterium]
MLKHLHIENYALISHLDIDFGAGFSVLTGETGAGKTIILGALALVMGARADSKSITDGEERCIIEAEFDDCIVRRELYRNGKSRSFVDDGLATVQELKELSARLIDIHSQHANLLLENNAFQLSVVDAIADNEPLLATYSTRHEAYLAAAEALATLKKQAAQSRQDADYIQFRYQTLADAYLQEGEMAELEEELYRLSHAEEIRLALEQTVAALNGEGGGVLEMLRQCRLEEAAPELQERLESSRIELQDISREAERLAERTEMDPERLQQVEERLDLLNSLLHKYNAQDEAELIRMRDELAEQVNRFDNFDHDISEAEIALQAATKALQETADALRAARHKVTPVICERLTAGLKRLGIAHAKIDLEYTETPDFTPTGRDEVQLLFAANLNQSLRAVSEVASGGEMSRLMLCVKALIASRKGLPTIFFDEIDTGVSGDIATQMAAIMREMSASRQIIAITHLPQIAAIGQTHYKVYKADTATRTETHIRLLNTDERINEIATMLSGNQPSPEAIANAKQLLCSH